MDTINGKLEQIGSLKYDKLYNNLILYYSNNKVDTIRKIKNPFSLNELLFEVKFKSKKTVEIYIDSLKQKKIMVSNTNAIRYYTPEDLFLRHTFFVYTKYTHNNVVYDQPNLNAKCYTDSIRFSCFIVKNVKNDWIKISTTNGDPCGNSEEGKINVGWIKWYDKNKLLLDIQSN